MLIKQIPIRNNLRNYMYLLACERTLEAIAIDPLDHALCLQVAKELGWHIKIVANTHHHHDHIGGNEPVITATGAELVAHAEAMQAIPNVDRGLHAGDTLQCGELSLKVMDTPGHTMSHICLYFACSLPYFVCIDMYFVCTCLYFVRISLHFFCNGCNKAFAERVVSESFLSCYEGVRVS